MGRQGFGSDGPEDNELRGLGIDACNMIGGYRRDRNKPALTLNAYDAGRLRKIIDAISARLKALGPTP